MQPRLVQSKADSRLVPDLLFFQVEFNQIGFKIKSGFKFKFKFKFEFKESKHGVQAEKVGKFYPTDWNKRSEVVQWLFFMNAGIGPMQGPQLLITDQSMVYHLNTIDQLSSKA
jgi:hypothetical protein